MRAAFRTRDMYVTLKYLKSMITYNNSSSYLIEDLELIPILDFAQFCFLYYCLSRFVELERVSTW